MVVVLLFLMMFRDVVLFLMCRRMFRVCRVVGVVIGSRGLILAICVMSCGFLLSVLFIVVRALRERWVGRLIGWLSA